MTRKNEITVRDCEQFKAGLLRKEHSYFVNVGGKWRLVPNHHFGYINDMVTIQKHLDSFVVRYDLYKLGHEVGDIYKYLTEQLNEAQKAHELALKEEAEREIRFQSY